MSDSLSDWNFWNLSRRCRAADSTLTTAACTAAAGRTAKPTATASAPDSKDRANIPGPGTTDSKSLESTPGLGNYLN